MREYVLEDIYTSYTIEDVKEIARFHGMKGFSKLKKAELVARTIEFILQPEIMKNCFVCFRDEEIEAFEKALAQNGQYFTEEIRPFARLIEVGYVGKLPGGFIVIPDEVEQVYHSICSSEFTNCRKQISHLVDCFLVAGRIYGAVPVQVMVELFNQTQQGHAIDAESLINKAKGLPKGINEFQLKEGVFIQQSLVKEELYEGLMKLQGEKQYYIPSIDEIHDMACYGYLPNEQRLIELVDFLIQEMNVEEKRAKELGKIIQNQICLNCTIQEIFNILENNGVYLQKDEQLQPLFEKINYLTNNSRMLINRGFTPNELNGEEIAPIQIVSKKKAPVQRINSNKVYPNDSCPCGSGKKYKHCCARVKK